MNGICSGSEFKCTDGSKCVPEGWVCDNEPDCPDRSDEEPSLCSARTCQEDQWGCQSTPGECIPSAWMCDGHPDCEDGSDESVCSTACTNQEYQCTNGLCIQPLWKESINRMKCETKLTFFCSINTTFSALRIKF